MSNLNNHFKFIGFIMAFLSGLLGVLLLIASFKNKYPHPIPAMFFLTSLGLFLGAIILLLLVIIIEQLEFKSNDTSAGNEG
jgi:uncharacterized YccA/Bax inhibitor family protein